MKKILFVATVVKTHIMVFHLPYLEWFMQQGYETHVCSRNDYTNKEECIIPYCDKYFDLPFERSPLKLKNLDVYKRLKKIIESNEYDIIHCHTPMGSFLTRLAARKARKKGTKIIYTAHGFHFFKGAPLKNWLLYYPAEKWLARYTDLLITINKEDYARAQKFKAKKTVYVKGVGVDTQKFRSEPVNRSMKRAEFGVVDGEIALLSVGELITRKNHEVVLRALKKLNNPNIIYIICGHGELDGYLKNLAQQLGIEEKVKFLGFRNDISEIYYATDIFVFPSFQEGLSVALMEAMAAQLPVVCSNIRGNTDLIEDGAGGYLIAPNDVDGFAGAINKVLAVPNNQLGQINGEKIKQFDLSNVIEDMKTLYTKELS